MTKHGYIVFTVLSAASTVTAQPQTETPRRPNILFILADDLGYGDLGCYGQKLIETPNIDSLALRGVRFTQHYAGSAVSAPSRACLLTGEHTGHVCIRGNDEMGSRGDVQSHQAMLDDPRLEGQYPMPASTVTLAHMAHEQGYATAMVGKWGLGYPGSDSTPCKMGFDYFFGYNCQRQAHNYYPMFLYENEERVYLDNAPLIDPHQQFPADADPMDEVSYKRYERREYAPELFYEKAAGFIRQHRSEPFFLMYTTTLPHLPLIAPERWVHHYTEKFGSETPFLAPDGRWLPTRYPHASYAAMISYLDEQVGKLVTLLRKLGIYENTLIIFTSDNGPAFYGGLDCPYFNSGGTFNCGVGWGKSSLHEGGIRVPLIINWPEKITEPRSSEHISACWDFPATFAQLWDAQTPHGDGIGFYNELIGGKQQQHPYLYWEYPAGQGSKAVRLGKWKGLLFNVRNGNKRIRLYNLETDPREQYDVASQHPEIVTRIHEIMQCEHTPSSNPRFEMDPALNGRTSKTSKMNHMETIKQ